MELVLRRHCTKGCTASLMTKGGGAAGGLCRKVCEENPAVPGKYQLVIGSEERICKPSIYKALACQEEHCGRFVRKLDKCFENNVNAKGRIKNECRPGMDPS